MTDIKCYSCVMDGAATDRSCETNPSEVITSPPTVTCKTRYCQIRRLEYSEFPGK